MNEILGKVIFDIDGCIADDRARRDLLPKEGKAQRDYDAYFLGCQGDPVINRKFLDHWISIGAEIIFITARPVKYRKITDAWITKNFPKLHEIECSLWMRPEGNMEPSPVLKKQLLLRECSTSGQPVSFIKAAYDDREDVVAMYREYGIKAEILSADPESALKASYDTPEDIAEMHREFGTKEEIPDILRGMIETFEERGKTYGKSYLTFGAVAAELWPDGLNLSGPAEFARHGILVQCIGKLIRYSGVKGGHKDSAHDLAVYAAMLESLAGESDNV